MVTYSKKYYLFLYPITLDHCVLRVGIDTNHWIRQFSRKLSQNKVEVKLLSSMAGSSTSTFAPGDVCSEFGMKKTSLEDGKVLCAYKDWCFTSYHSTMIDSSELDALQGDIASGVDEEYQLHVPPMVFDNDEMKLEFCGGFSLEFSAKEALRVWARKHLTSDVAILEVPYAKEWKEKSLFSQGKQAHVSAAGEGDTTAPPQSEAGSGEMQDSVFAKVIENTDTKKRAWDWTFSSDYCGSVTNNGAIRETMTLTDLVEQLGKENINCVPRADSGINYDMLRDRTAPILFYDEAVLYQDDLEDCGEVTFDVKLRVMPTCWFLLSRMFLRVDQVTIRFVEGRYFHQFGSTEVSLDVVLKECAIGEVKSPDSKNDGTAGLPHMNIPVTVQRDANKLSQLVPTLAQTSFKMII